MSPDDLKRSLLGPAGSRMAAMPNTMGAVGNHAIGFAKNRIQGMIPKTPDDVLNLLTRFNPYLNITNFVAEKATGIKLPEGFRIGVTTGPDGNPVQGTKYSPGANIPPMVW